MIEIKKHKGKSGKSVFEWRIYSVYENGSRFQLAKYRTLESAEKAAEAYRANNLRVAAVNAAHAARQG
jgi:hypothetical protein